MPFFRPLACAIALFVLLAASATADPPRCDPSAHVTPTRDEAGDAMRSAAPSVRACVQSPGSAQIKVHFVCDGSVERVELESAPELTTDERACIERVLRAVRIPPFRQAQFSVSFPFTLGGPR